MELIEILGMPTVIDNTHESCFRSYHVLIHVMTMMERGDSKETILDTIKLLYGKLPHQ